MAFITRLNLQDNRQHFLPERTENRLSGKTSFGLPFSALTTGPDPSSSGVTNTIINIYSTFSGNTGTTIFNFGDPNMNIAQSKFSAITNSNSAITQDSGNVFVGNTIQIIDGNQSYLDYTGVSFDIEVSSITETSPGIFTGTVFTNDLYYLSAGTLDFTGRTIWVDVDGITKTDKIIISNGAVNGYVLTSDSEGMGIWKPLTSSTSGDTFLTGALFNDNTLSIFRNDGNIISATWTGNSSGSCISNFHVSNIHSCSPLYINPNQNGNVYFGNTAFTIDFNNGDTILHNNGSMLFISKDYDYSFYSGTYKTTNGVICARNWSGKTASIFSNAHISGISGVYVGNYSGTTELGGTIQYFGPSYIRDGITPTGLDFYQNKVLISSTFNTDGIVIKPSAHDPYGTLWFEVNGHSTGIMYSDSGYWGFGLNNDGSEMPTAHLQIGGTASTGTFRFLDGNEANGKVMTSDANGYVSWEDLNTFWVSGDSSTSFKSKYGVNLYVNGDNSFIGGGSNNTISASTNLNSTAIIAGRNNTISGSFGTDSTIIGGYNNEIIYSDSLYNSIIAGINNKMDQQVTESVIIGGSNNLINTSLSNVVILGGTNITATTSSMVYVPDLIIDGLTSTDPLATDANGKIVAGASDIRLKKNIKSLENGLDKILKLRGVEYEWTEESKMGVGKRFGLIAQEVNEVIPEMVRERSKGDGMLTINYNEVIPWLIEAIKDIVYKNYINTTIETQKIIAEDNIIELNFNGNHITSNNGGIILNCGVNDEINSSLTIDNNGIWEIYPGVKTNKLNIPKYTPESTNDKYGSIGDIVWDDKYLYVKNNNGWGRCPLEKF